MNKNYKYNFVLPYSLGEFVLYLLVCFSFTVIGTSQTNIANVNEVFQKSLYKFSFSEAEKIIANLENSKFDRSDLKELKYQLAWWFILSGYKVSDNIDKCKLFLNEGIDDYNQISDPPIDTQVKLINAYLFKLRIENYSHKKIGSLTVLKKLLEKVDKLDNTSGMKPDKKILIGLYYYFLKYIKQEYILARLVLMDYNKGDKKTGLKYLEECADSNDEIVRTEAVYFLHKIYFTIEKQYSKAEEKINLLLNLYPENLVFAFEYFKVLLAQNKLDEAKEFKINTIKKIHGSENLYIEQKNHFIDLFTNYEFE
jgi:hypothetical protein